MNEVRHDKIKKKMIKSVTGRKDKNMISKDAGEDKEIEDEEKRIEAEDGGRRRMRIMATRRRSGNKRWER